VAQPGRREPLGALDGPDASFDADSGPDQGLHDIGRPWLGEVDGGVVRSAPGAHELKTALGVGFDLGAGRHAYRHAAGAAHLRDHLVHDPRLQRLEPLGVARVQMDRARPRGDAGGGVPRQLLDRHGRRGVFGLRSVAVERRL